MEPDWQDISDYEGWKRMIRPINHVAFSHEVKMWRESWPEVVLYSNGSTFDAAVDHSVIRINGEISKLGS